MSHHIGVIIASFTETSCVDQASEQANLFDKNQGLLIFYVYTMSFYFKTNISTLAQLGPRLCLHVLRGNTIFFSFSSVICNNSKMISVTNLA